MRRLFAALAASLALLASGAPTQAQVIPPSCENIPLPDAECVVRETVEYLKAIATDTANDIQTRAWAEAQTQMWELYAAQGELPDVPIEPGDPAFETFDLEAPGPGDVEDSQAPFRGMFYYPWYPEDWGDCSDGSPARSHYIPTRGCYSQDENSTLEAHVNDMANAGVEVGISSWFRTDPGTSTQSKRDIRFLPIMQASGTRMVWSLYYEREGESGAFGDPSWSTIRSDLNYIAGKYAGHTNFLRVNNRPVIFVYADPDDACGDGVDGQNSGPNEMVERWWQALRQTTRTTTVPIPNFHVVFKVFDQNPAGGSDYKECPKYPASFSFHQYGPDAPTDHSHSNPDPAVNPAAQGAVGNGSYVISPGFWHFNDSAPRDNSPTGPGPEDTTRDLVEFRTSVRAQIASGKFWQLTTSYNEFIEGTQVESDTRFGHIYLDALVNDGAEPTITGTVMGAGDIACGPEHSVTPDTCKQLETSNLMVGQATAVVALGDLQYEDGTLAKFQSHYHPSWGRLFDITNPAIGNHEYLDTSDPSDPAGDGHFDYWGPRAGPRRPNVGSSGEAVYPWDHGGWNFLVLNGSCSQVSPGMGGCGVGSLQYNFVNNYLASNTSSCEVVYMHFPRWSDGQHGNTDRPDTNLALSPLYDLLVQHGVELLLVGHDHDYQRFPMAADDAAGVGVVMPEFGVRQIVVGTGGKNHTSVNTSDPLGADIDPEVWNDDTFGVLRLDLRPNDATFRFIPIAGQTFTDGPFTVTCHS